MKTLQVAIALCIVISFSAPAFAADPWSKQDIALETLWVALHVIDWGQTRYIAKHPTFYEGNPLLGKHPSVSKVDAYFAVGTLLHVGITHILPSKYRPYWQMITIGGSGYCVINNESLGVGLNFSF